MSAKQAQERVGKQPFASYGWKEHVRPFQKRKFRLFGFRRKDRLEERSYFLRQGLSLLGLRNFPDSYKQIRDCGLDEEKQFWLIAFEPKSGRVAWKVERNYQTPPECDHSYATPTLIRQKGEEAILCWGAERLSAHSAKDGSILWVSTGFNPKQKKNWVVVGSQVVAGEVAVVPYGRGTHLAGIKLGGKGGVTDTHRMWTRTDSGSFVPTPAVANGKVTSCVTAARFTALTRRRAKAIGKMPSLEPARIITDHLQ